MKVTIESILEIEERSKPVMEETDAKINSMKDDLQKKLSQMESEVTKEAKDEASLKFSEIMASAEEEVKKRKDEIQNELSKIDENFKLQKDELVEEAFKKFILKG